MGQPHTSREPFSLTLVVPVFNEAHRFASFAGELAEFVLRYADGSVLVFSDDGSDDGTPSLIQQFAVDHPDVPVRVLRLPHRGKGAALSAGLATADTAVAAFCDLDLSTSLADLAQVIEAAASTPAMAIGSRGTPTSSITRHQSFVRERMGRAYNRVVQLALVPGIVDTQCGAKAAATEIWKQVLPRCAEEGFAWDVEVLAVARALRIPVQEIGVEWEHRDGSRIRLGRDGLAMLRAVPRIRRRLARTSDAPAPELSGPTGELGTFSEQSAAWLVSVDPTHWWLRSKAAFVASALRRHDLHDGWLVDVGAGSAAVTAMIGWTPTHTVALEGNELLAKTARGRHAVETVLSDAERLPLRDGSARVVCLLDVIEHAEDPGPILREARRVLAPDGRLVVNVPAHEWLWSEADQALGHVRRYTRRRLREHLHDAGWEVVWSSHVFSWLVPPVWWKRKASSSGEPQLGLDRTSWLVDRLSMVLTRLEWFLVARVPLPIGTSILCVARRR